MDLAGVTDDDLEFDDDDIDEDLLQAVAESLERDGYVFTEEKVRLDKSCWKNKKIGTPKTKLKGGVRVNNCVPK